MGSLPFIDLARQRLCKLCIRCHQACRLLQAPFDAWNCLTRQMAATAHMENYRSVWQQLLSMYPSMYVYGIFMIAVAKVLDLRTKDTRRSPNLC